MRSGIYLRKRTIFCYTFHMDEKDTKSLLEKNVRLAEENNKLLKKIYGSIKWGRFFKAFYWILIIGTSIGAYYYLQPVIETMQDSLRALLDTGSSIKDFGESLPDIGNILQR